METETTNKFVTYERVFWAIIYDLCLMGLIAVGVGGHLLYKEVWLGKKAFMVGEIESFEAKDIEGATFTKQKGK